MAQDPPGVPEGIKGFYFFRHLERLRDYSRDGEHGLDGQTGNTGIPEVGNVKQLNS